jgi:CheY-like chemotaxis protein/anti-sigma regulatory factor (Ser/Thr protein kinase)
MKTLVVDDTLANRQLLSWLLEDLGHEVIEAEDGREAIAAYHERDPDLVLMDVMMPIMDGYEAARAIKEHTHNKYVPIIFLTAITDQEGLTKCLEAGGDDFLTKPINEQILKAKIDAHSRIKGLTDQLNEKKAALEQYKWQMDNEREMAINVFQSAQRTNYLNSNNTDYALQPANQFNGDILLGAPSPSGGHYFVIGDFTGHGLAASIGTLPLSKVFFERTQCGDNVGDIARAMNTELNRFLPSTMFCAATIIEQSQNGQDLTLWSGGLPDGLILNRDGSIAGIINSQHMPLAALEDHEFEREVSMHQLNSDQQLILYTDGIIEACNKDGEMFGEDRFAELIKAHNDQPISVLMEAHRQWYEPQIQEDDITILKLAANEVEHDYTLSRNDDRAPLNLPWQFNIELHPKEMQQTDVIIQIVELLGTVGVLRNHKDYLHIIISELYSNALEHGVLNLDSAMKDTEEGYVEYYAERNKRLLALDDDAKIVIHIALKPNSEGLLVEFRCQNSGDGFDVNTIRASTDDDSYGRGLFLIRELCEKLEFSDLGRQVTVEYLARNQPTTN